MRSITKLVLGASVAFAGLSTAQVMLILGKPNTLSPVQYAASTAEPLPDGSVALRETLIDVQKHGGFWWFDIDYDLHQAYLLTDRSGAAVLDLDSGAIVKRCEIPRTPGKGNIFEWRIVDPTLGPVLTILRGNAFPPPGDTSGNVWVGMVADPAIPCAQSSMTLRDEHLVYIASGGQAGVGGEASQRFFGNFAQGKFRSVGNSGWIYFPIALSVDSLKEFSPTPEGAAILVRNKSIEAISVYRGKPGASSEWARERSPGSEWIRLPIPREEGPNVRGFGTYLAWPESFWAELQDERIKDDPKLAATKVEPAGKQEWSKADSKWGVAPEFVMTHSATVHPGILHIFDVKTRRHFQIQTGQSDSEVLLVEDNIVYYRCSDRLFRAEIHGDQLTGHKQIAQSELVRDAHWAFIPRASQAHAVVVK